MEEDNTIVITKKNRRLLGFLGVEHEYLLLFRRKYSQGAKFGVWRRSERTPFAAARWKGSYCLMASDP